MCDEEWPKVAMADDAVVVQLLLSLSQPQPKPPPNKMPPCLHLDWTVRQRRSRSVPRHVGTEKKGEPTRASPSTPLSWSGATSASGGTGVDGYEESSRPMKPMEGSRSKSAFPSETTTTKRSRRKKTLAELKEEENILLKERRNLKDELASLRLLVENHRATNERLKRMKLDLESRQTFKTATSCVTSEKAIIGQSQLVEAQCHPSNSVSVCQANVSSKAQENCNQEASFFLPDLNMPVEEDLSSTPMVHMDSANKELHLH